MAIDDETVTFRYRDRRDPAQGDVLRTMRLDGEEFLRRFLLHVLPRRFVRIRSYGLLANRNRAANLARSREALGGEPEGEAGTPAARESWHEAAARLLGHDPLRCPACGQGRLAPASEIRPHARPPPAARREVPAMTAPASVPRLLRLPGARKGVRSLRNRVDSEPRNEATDPAIVAPRRPEGTRELPAAVESTKPGPLERPRGCARAPAAAIENP